MNFILNTFVVALTCAALLCGGQNLEADIIWNESVSGDLSSNPAIPTGLTFINGANTIIGTLSEPNGDLRDYITFTLGPNQFLTSLFLDAFTPNGLGFQGLNSGSTSFIPDTATAGNFLGLDFIHEGMVGTDMLPGLSQPVFGNTGFTIPLGPGTYSYVNQEVTPGQFRSYQMTFNVIPEPSSAGLICLAGLLIATRRGRKS